MSSSEIGELSAFDPVLNAFRVLGQLYNLAVSFPLPTFNLALARAPEWRKPHLET